MGGGGVMQPPLAVIHWWPAGYPEVHEIHSACATKALKQNLDKHKAGYPQIGLEDVLKKDLKDAGFLEEDKDHDFEDPRMKKSVCSPR